MIGKTKLLLTLFALLLVPSAVSAQPFKGTVTDPGGAVLSRARVLIHWDPSGGNQVPDNLGIKEDIVAITDNNGEFSINLPTGFYDVFISFMAFQPEARKIRVRNGAVEFAQEITKKKKKGTVPPEFRVTMKISDIVFKELD
jgi:Carboxypeptidase regulatory-like domain